MNVDRSSGSPAEQADHRSYPQVLRYGIYMTARFVGDQSGMGLSLHFLTCPPFRFCYFIE